MPLEVDTGLCVARTLNARTIIGAVFEALYRETPHPCLSFIFYKLHTIDNIKSSARRIGAKALSIKTERQEHLLRGGATAGAYWPARLRNRQVRSARALTTYRPTPGQARRAAS